MLSSQPELEWHASGCEGSARCGWSADSKQEMLGFAKPQFQKVCCCCWAFPAGFPPTLRGCYWDVLWITCAESGDSKSLLSFSVHVDTAADSPLLAWNRLLLPRGKTTPRRMVKHFEDSAVWQCQAPCLGPLPSPFPITDSGWLVWNYIKLWVAWFR